MLVDPDGVADEGEVDEGELEDVVAQVAFEEDFAGLRVDCGGAGGEVGGAGEGVEGEADEVGDVCFCSGEGGVCCGEAENYDVCCFVSGYDDRGVWGSRVGVFTSKFARSLVHFCGDEILRYHVPLEPLGQSP